MAEATFSDVSLISAVAVPENIITSIQQTILMTQ
jgi:hypothetical protein